MPPRPLLALTAAAAALWVLPQTILAQQDFGLTVTAQQTSPGRVAVTGDVTLPNACWGTGELTEGAPTDTPGAEGALPLTLSLSHSGGQMCAMILAASPFAGEFALPAGISAIDLHLTPPEGHALPPLLAASPRHVPVE